MTSPTAPPATDVRRRGFGSDNHASVHPEVMAALAAADGGHQRAYGDDEMTKAGCFQKEPNGTDYNTSVSMVAKGDALGLINGNWAISALKDAAAADASFTLNAVPASDDTGKTQMAAAASGAPSE